MKIPVTNEQAIYFCGNVPSGGSGGLEFEQSYSGSAPDVCDEIELDFNEPITAKFPNEYSTVTADAFKNCKYIPENVDFNNIETISNGERGAGILSITVTNRVFNDIKLKNVRTVGAYAFYNAHIKNIYFGGNIESAGSNAFDGGEIENVYYAGPESSWNNLGITGSAFSQSTFHFNYEF